MDTQEMSLTFAREIADITRLNNWIFNIIHPYIKGRTLELGSADGGISSMFIKRGLPIHLTDEDNTNREKLQKKFEGITAMRMIHDINFYHDSFEKVYADRAGVFSTVLAVNIAEHGCYNENMLHNAEYFLAVRGYFIVVTSAKAVLFDKAAYNSEGLKEYNYKVARNLMVMLLKYSRLDISIGQLFLKAGTLMNPDYIRWLYSGKNELTFKIPFHYALIPLQNTLSFIFRYIWRN